MSHSVTYRQKSLSLFGSAPCHISERQSFHRFANSCQQLSRNLAEFNFTCAPFLSKRLVTKMPRLWKLTNNAINQWIQLSTAHTVRCQIMIPAAAFLRSAGYLKYKYIIYSRGAQIEGAGEARRLNFLQWLLSKCYVDIPLLIVWFGLQRKKCWTWRWHVKGPKHVIERSYVRTSW